MIFGEAIPIPFRPRFRRVALALLGAAGMAMVPQAARAQAVWGGPGSTTSGMAYKTGTNWSTGTVPNANGDTARFAGTGNSTVNINGGTITPDSWTFAANSKSFVISGTTTVNFNAAAGSGLIND